MFLSIFLGVIVFTAVFVYFMLSYIIKKINYTYNKINSDFHNKIVKVEDLINESKVSEASKFGAVSSTLVSTNQELAHVRDSVNKLNAALTNTKVRGQFGEKIADDVIKAIGLKEGINYVKQAEGSSGSRPDFTFFLPNGMKVNMDAKFPLNNYLLYMDAIDEASQKLYLQKFLKDVRSRVKEATSKDYINVPEGTLDFVIVFIPNEAVMWFVLDNDPTFMDYCLQNKAVLCTAWSLYMILAVIHQATTMFEMEQNMGEIIKVIQKFSKEWASYKGEDDKVDKKLTELVNMRGTMRDLRSKSLESCLEEIKNYCERKV